MAYYSFVNDPLDPGFVLPLNRLAGFCSFQLLFEWTSDGSCVWGWAKRENDFDDSFEICLQSGFNSFSESDLYFSCITFRYFLLLLWLTWPFQRSMD